MRGVGCADALLLLLLAASPLLKAGTVCASNAESGKSVDPPHWATKTKSDWSMRLPRCLRAETPPGVAGTDVETAMELSASSQRKSGRGTSRTVDVNRCGSSAFIRTKAVEEHWDIHSDELVLMGKLGEGASGNVYEGEWRGLRVAVKMLISTFAENSTQYQDFVYEIELLSQLRHPLLVTFLGVQIEADPPCIVSEMMVGGSIEDLYLSKARETGNPWVATRRQIHGWICNVLTALRFLHEGTRMIIHRDIKPGNIMLTKEWTWAKLGDFGLSKEYVKVPASADGKKGGMSGRAGTVRFMAPEVFAEEEYTERADIYSLGMCLYFMVTGVKPFNDFTDQNALGRLVRERNIRPSLVDFQWPELEKIITASWAPKDEDRPSARQMLEMLREKEVLDSLDTVAPKKRHNPFRQGISF